jgi:hypothetical protein
MNTTNENMNDAKQTFTDRCLQSCKVLLAEIEQAKKMIVNDFRETLDTHGNLFRLALNEAEAFALQTDYPHLVYPALAMERVQAVVAWRGRQRAVQQYHSVFAENRSSVRETPYSFKGIATA